MSWNLDKLLIEFCAPVLMGVKPANLFRYSSEGPGKVHQEIQSWNESLNKFGINLVIIKECPVNNLYLIYAYRKKLLEPILVDNDNQSFLKKYGYHPNDSLDKQLNVLSSHLCPKNEFPHEIGIFLGYPLKDVVGFIENHGHNYLYSDYWLVYSNLNKTIELFDMYHDCTSYCINRFKCGDSVLELAVTI